MCNTAKLCDVLHIPDEPFYLQGSSVQVVIILYTQECCSWLNNRVDNERGGKPSWFIEEHQI
jgi:hypothetical protein